MSKTTKPVATKTASNGNEPHGHTGDVEELAWKCHKCSRHNLLHKLKCPILTCKARKGRSNASTRTSTKGCEIVWGVERHGDECAVCGYGGELICCDNCDNVYHGKCLEIDDPETLPDHWHCPACQPDSRDNKKMPAKSRVKNLREIKHDIADDGTKHEKRKCCNNFDECYICDNGGHLVCCDHCDKSFHMHCHIPPLLSIPKGKWKCCECAAWSFKKRNKCGECEACLREDCGKCIYCLDKPKFGGKLKLKQVCVHKRCPLKRYASPATVTPDGKRKKMSGIKNEDVDDGDDRPVASSASAGKMVVRGNAGKRKYRLSGNKEASRRSKRAHNPSPKAKEAAAVKPKRKANRVPARKISAGRSKSGSSRSKPASSIGVPSTAAGRIMVIQRNNTANTARRGATSDDRKPAASVEVPAGVGADDMDAYSQATVPFPKNTDGGNVDDDEEGESDDNSATSNDLWMCQMELERARAENERKANEITRLKSAIQALTASLTA